MATENLDIKINVDDNNAQAKLAKLNKQVDGLSGAFSTLRTALAGLAFGAAIANANRFADAISDLSDATEISIQNILGFNSAIMANGGTSEGAQKGMAKLVASIDEAASAAGNGREAFKDVGVSLTDLRTLTSEQIFQKAITGLAGISDVATRARIATELLGKEAKLINFKNVADDFSAASAKSAGLASAYKAGADAQQAMETNMKNFTSALLQVIEPLNRLVASINISVEGFTTLLKILGYLAGAYVIFGKGLGTVTAAMNIMMPLLRASGGLFAFIGASIAKTFGYLVAFGGHIVRAAAVVTGFATSTSGVIGVLAAAGAALGRFLLRFAGLTGIILAAAEAINYIIKKITGFDVIDAAVGKLGELYDATKKYLGLGEEGPKGRSYSAEDSKRMQEDLDKRNAEIKRGQEAMAKFNGEIAKSKLESKQVLQIQGESLSNTAFRIGFEKSLVGLTEDQKEMQTQLYDIEMKRLDLQDDYARAIKKLEQERSTTKDEEANRLLSARIQIIKDEAKESSELYSRHKEGIGDQIRLLQSAKMIEAARLQDQQNMVKAIEDQISRQQTLGGLMQSANDKLVDTQFAGAQQGRSPMEQKMASIQEEARKAALEAGRALSAGFEGMDLTTAQAKELADGLSQIAERYKAIADEQTKQLEASRTWDAGWKTAFDNYMDNATNAAMRAGEVFNTITGNMSNAIDKFVETGKFSFGDFARSIIQDLIKIELKAQATKLLGAIGGGGGIFSAIGSLFGFANGGNPPINKPSIVGEKGPELFVPKTAGTIIPNGGSMGGTNQGMAPTNNITNNYNISAIDSKSVAQFFAENRKTMLGTMQLAQKELPYGNR